MGVSQDEFNKLSKDVEILQKEVSKKTIDYYGYRYATVYGEIDAIKKFLNIDTKIEGPQEATVKVVPKKKVSKK